MLIERINTGLKQSTNRILTISKQWFVLCFLSVIYTISIYGQDFWIKRGLGNSDIQFLTLGPDSTLYAGVYLPGVPDGYSIYKATDAGISWLQLNNGLPQNFLMSQLITDSTTDIFLAADSALYRIRGSDTVWTKVLSMGSGGLILSATADSTGNIFIGTYQGTIYKSTNHGDSWQLSYSPAQGEEIRSHAISQSGNIIASLKTFLGLTWIIHSTDKGINWSTISQFGYYFDQLTVSSTSGSILGIESGGVWLFRSTDEGFTWSKRDSALGNDRFTSIIFADNGKLFACGAGVFFSTDEGLEWFDITYNLPSSVHSLAIGIDGYLYVGTYDNGIWKSSQRVTAVSEELVSYTPEQFFLDQNYPNPFNPTTKIQYDIPTYTKVQLKVYDILGREVKTLVNEFQNAGRYTLDFSTSNLASGVFIYQLYAKGFVKSRKMIVLK